MARLRTLGTLELSDAQGQAIDGILSRQRRAALLVYLAVEGRRGFVRRETLFGVFWPELDQTRARAALRQALYVLRSEIGEEVVITRGADDVATTAALACDATLFEEHADAGRFAEARALYRGPFLNAFFISEAPEFERWVDERREALNRRAALCGQQLAGEARARGDLPAAIDHLRHALALQPTDEATLRTLMRVLEASGDRAAALREFTRHAEALRREYEIEPSEETTATVREIQERGKSAEAAGRAHESSRPQAVSPSKSPSIAAPVDADAPTRDADAPAVDATAPTVTRAPLQKTAGPPVRDRRALPMVVVSSLIAMLAIIGIVRLANRPAAADRDEPRLVVLPFTVRVGPDLAYLGEGMSDLLSTSLDGPDLFRAVSPALVLRDARDRGADPATPAAGRATAQRFGASHFLLGSVVASNALVRFDARLYATSGAAPIAQATMEGSPDSIFTLVDRLAAQIIAASRGRQPAERLRGSAALTTRSLSALREYLSGERALRDGAFGSAVEFFRQAVATDTTFALAYYRMSMAAEWLAEPQQAFQSAALALRHARRLSERDGALLQAHYTMLLGADEEAERQYRAIIGTYPDDAEAWLKLGEIAFHNYPRRGRSLQEADPPFTRVLSYEPTHRASLLHLVRITADAGNLARMDSLAARYLALGVTDGALGVRLVAASVHHDSLRVRELIAAAAAEPDESITDAARDVFLYGRDPAAALAILAINLGASRGPERRVLTRLRMAAIELTRGHRAAARRQFSAAAAIGFPDAVRLLEAYYALFADPYRSRAELQTLRTTLESLPVAGSATPARLPLLAPLLAAAPQLRAFLLTEVTARLGDDSASHRHQRDLESLPIRGPGVQPIRDQQLRVAAARRALRGGQAAQALPELTAERTTASRSPINWTFPWHAGQRWTNAEALAASGDERAAAALFQSFSLQSVFVAPFVAPGYLRAARTLEKLGDREAAMQAYERVADVWRDADPEYRGDVEAARARLAAIRSGRP